MKKYTIPLPINLYYFSVFEDVDEKTLHILWTEVTNMKTFLLKDINSKIVEGMKEFLEIFKFSKYNSKKNECKGCFHIYLLREIQILYKIKIIFNKDIMTSLKVLLGLHLTTNHVLENEKQYLDFLLNSIFNNFFNIFSWKEKDENMIAVNGDDENGATMRESNYKKSLIALFPVITDSQYSLKRGVSITKQ